MAENPIAIRPTLSAMEKGDKVLFPIAKMKSVRAQASELGVILNRRYQTKSNRADRTIAVTRTE
ncbi:MAG: hypothetical protein HDS42_06215 [Bacteroides sp.]|nr:hypothetical protein [Bacteroides sp.]